MHPWAVAVGTALRSLQGKICMVAPPPIAGQLSNQLCLCSFHLPSLHMVVGICSHTCLRDLLCAGRKQHLPASGQGWLNHWAFACLDKLIVRLLVVSSGCRLVAAREQALHGRMLFSLTCSTAVSCWIASKEVVSFAVRPADDPGRGEGAKRLSHHG
jgi:hypothetical protein